jgi:hypothetical protein
MLDVYKYTDFSKYLKNSLWFYAVGETECG